LNYLAFFLQKMYNWVCPVSYGKFKETSQLLLNRSKHRYFNIFESSLWLRKVKDQDGEKSRCLNNTRITLHALTSSLGYVHRIWRYVVNLNFRDCAIHVPTLSIRLDRSNDFYTRLTVIAFDTTKHIALAIKAPSLNFA